MTDPISIPSSKGEEENGGSSSPTARSLRSVSVSSSPLELSADTLGLLNQFQAQRHEEEERFRKLEEVAERRRREAAGLKGTGDDAQGAQEDDEAAKELLSVDEFRNLFGESWQLSQFWYSQSFSTHLAKCLMAELEALPDPSSGVIVFISCPTAFVGFQHLYRRSVNTYLLEYDARFHLLGTSPSQFVKYDLDEPEALPEHLLGMVDIAVVDPPFLNEVTCRKVASSVKRLLRPSSAPDGGSPEGKMLLLTGRAVSDTAKVVYDEVAGVKLRDTSLQVEHAGGLANEFGAWASFDDAESFGQGQ